MSGSFWQPMLSFNKCSGHEGEATSSRGRVLLRNQPQVVMQPILPGGPQHITVCNGVILAEMSSVSLHSLLCPCFIFIRLLCGECWLLFGPHGAWCLQPVWLLRPRPGVGGPQGSETGGALLSSQVLFVVCAVTRQCSGRCRSAPLTTEATCSF